MSLAALPKKRVGFLVALKEAHCTAALMLYFHGNQHAADSSVLLNFG